MRMGDGTESNAKEKKDQSSRAQRDDISRLLIKGMNLTMAWTILGRGHQGTNLGLISVEEVLTSSLVQALRPQI